MKDYKEDHERMEEPLEINNSSLYELELELKKFPKKEGEIQRLYAESVQVVNNLLTKLEVVTAQMVERITKRYKDKGEKVSFTSRDIIRKTEVALEPEYQEVKSQLDEANTQKTYILGLCKSMSSKSHRLTELTNLMMKYRHDELYIPQGKKGYDNKATIDGMDMEK